MQASSDCEDSSVNERPRDERIQIRLMNEYWVTIPLWDDEGQTDGEELGLSEELYADLASFQRRWEASIPADVFDDRFDGYPVVRFLVESGRSLRRRANMAARRAAEQEDAELRRLGEELRDRLERELGSRYRVIYKH